MDDKKIITILHSGDIGDIISSLCAVKQICEKENAKAHYILDPTGGHWNGELDPYVALQSSTGNKFDFEAARFVRPLIERQPYVEKCSIMVGKVPQPDINLNSFRKHFIDIGSIPKHHQNLMFLHQLACGLPMGYVGPWLETDVRDGDREDFTLFARSTRYQSAHVLYDFLIHRARQIGPVKFIGTDLEHQVMTNCFRVELPRQKGENAVEMAEEVAKARTVVCNGTALLWIAYGLGHPDVFSEVAVDIPTTVFQHPSAPDGIHYIQGGHFVTYRKKEEDELKSSASVSK